MAAQTFTTRNYFSGPVFATNYPGVIDRSAFIDLDTLIGPDGTAATTLEANDVIKIFKLPPNAKILGGRVECEDLDSHATPTLEFDLQVTDGTTTKLIFDGITTVAQAGGFIDSSDAGGTGVLNAFSTNSAIGYVTPDGETDWYLALKCITAPATAQNDGIRVCVRYTFAVENEEFDRDFPTPNP
jgi:hypothetical protein